ncbi:hypothetical protein BAUCODRAFT_213396 [Baudoinia panamericana UAMH 10762]|uniref:Uncharacterized protein n=1 Tax=Baudoinia panamericana (strain UAMH 10762) TaxID=717646 RepID=M2MQY5_BAUPA|nr:uncharacterized protein BAUCODRAFT_213396 [Baudoinia panamericana UAMH 10762]EMC93888.1 hypothetical protein BAUCODRAFT_213396 [Baudoinia panamericana UAMH 10762]
MAAKRDLKTSSSLSCVHHAGKTADHLRSGQHSYRRSTDSSRRALRSLQKGRPRGAEAVCHCQSTTPHTTGEASHAIVGSASLHRSCGCTLHYYLDD